MVPERSGIDDGHSTTADDRLKKGAFFEDEDVVLAPDVTSANASTMLMGTDCAPTWSPVT